MRPPYLLSGSFAYDTILTNPGKFQSRLKPDAESINVCFDVSEVREEFGGCGGNIAYSAGQLHEGNGPVLTGVLGADGYRFREHLRKYGLNDATLTFVRNDNCPHAWIVGDTDGNQITSFSFGAMSVMPVLPPETPHLWHLAPGNARTTAALAKQAIAEKKSYFFDPGQALPSFIEGVAADILELKDIVNHASGIFVNEHEATLLEAALGQTLWQLAKPGTFVVKTMGAAGATLYAANGGANLYSALVHNVVDPTGCGDAFRAAFLYSYCAGETLRDCVAAGIVMGALAVGHLGGQKHHVSPADLRAGLEKYRLGEYLDECPAAAEVP